jgi:hypothetical protein
LWAFSVPSGTTFIGSSISQADGIDQVTATGFQPAGTGANQTIVIKGTVISSSTAGNVVFRWAQNTATASDTKVLAGSYLEYKKLN